VERCVVSQKVFIVHLVEGFLVHVHCLLIILHSDLLLVFLFVEGVGKSSLISTFVSRHFSEVVPGIMTRVRLPPDPENSCITTIVDSQGGDVALSSALATMSIPTGDSAASSASLSSLRKSISSNALNNLGGVEKVDSIILVYDLDRDETFFRLENHWLPLIERCYNGEVSTFSFRFFAGVYPSTI
jgi:GTPase SAR1 family protein